jgi:hypothetical protein
MESAVIPGTERPGACDRSGESNKKNPGRESFQTSAFEPERNKSLLS